MDDAVAGESLIGRFGQRLADSAVVRPRQSPMKTSWEKKAHLNASPCPPHSPLALVPLQPPSRTQIQILFESPSGSLAVHLDLPLVQGDACPMTVP